MNFNEMKKGLEETTAPEMNTDTPEHQPKGKAVDRIIDGIRKQDRKAKFSLIGTQVAFSLWIVVLLFYVFSEGVLLRQVGFATLIVAFFLGIYRKQRQLEKYHASDFDSSMTEFLERARTRLAFSVKWQLYAVIWLLFDVGLCLLVASVPRIGPFTSSQIIVLVQLVFVLGISFELAMDYSRWKRNSKPVIDEIDRMLNEIEAG